MQSGPDRHLRNKRRYLRAAAELPVACRDLSADKTFVATLRDLSASGASIRAPYRPTRSTPLYLAVGHDSLGLVFTTAAHVVRTERTREGDFLWGVKFAPLPIEMTAQIGRFVVARQAQTASAA